MRIDPEKLLRSIRPPKTSRRVLFPAPDDPKIASDSPALTEPDTPRKMSLRSRSPRLKHKKPMLQHQIERSISYVTYLCAAPPRCT